MAIKETTVPAESLRELDLHEGDRLSGEVRDGNIIFKVTEMIQPKRTPEQIARFRAFLDEWSGKFAGLTDADFSDDPRADYILNH